MAWWIQVAPEVIDGLNSFGFAADLVDEIRQTVESYLAHHGDKCAQQRWEQCPDDFFVYTHVVVAAGRLHTLEFVVGDSSAAAGVFNVVWVEHHPGRPLDLPGTP